MMQKKIQNGKAVHILGRSDTLVRKGNWRVVGLGDGAVSRKSPAGAISESESQYIFTSWVNSDYAYSEIICFPQNNFSLDNRTGLLATWNEESRAQHFPIISHSTSIPNVIRLTRHPTSHWVATLGKRVCTLLYCFLCPTLGSCSKAVTQHLFPASSWQLDFGWYLSTNNKLGTTLLSAKICGPLMCEWQGWKSIPPQENDTVLFH